MEKEQKAGLSQIQPNLVFLKIEISKVSKKIVLLKFDKNAKLDYNRRSELLQT